MSSNVARMGSAGPGFSISGPRQGAGSTSGPRQGAGSISGPRRGAGSTDELPLAKAIDYLGPGHVVEVQGHEVTVEMPSGARARAEMALSMPYAAAVGDVLLVIGRGADHYVIGVLHGRGTTSLSFKGGVDIRATGGPLTLSSDHGVAIHGPETEIRSGKLRVIAGAVVEKFDSLYQRVRGALDIHASRAHTLVDGTSFMTAKNASIVTEQTMTINGEQIHLG